MTVTPEACIKVTCTWSYNIASFETIKFTTVQKLQEMCWEIMVFWLVSWSSVQCWSQSTGNLFYTLGMGLLTCPCK